MEEDAQDISPDYKRCINILTVENQAGKGVWLLLSEVQRASAKHLIVREMYCS